MRGLRGPPNEALNPRPPQTIPYSFLSAQSFNTQLLPYCYSWHYYAWFMPSISGLASLPGIATTMMGIESCWGNSPNQASRSGLQEIETWSVINHYYLTHKPSLLMCYLFTVTRDIAVVIFTLPLYYPPKYKSKHWIMSYHSPPIFLNWSECLSTISTKTIGSSISLM